MALVNYLLLCQTFLFIFNLELKKRERERKRQTNPLIPFARTYTDTRNTKGEEEEGEEAALEMLFCFAVSKEED